MRQRFSFNRILRTLSIFVLFAIYTSMIAGAFVIVATAYKNDANKTAMERRQVEQMTSSTTPLPATPTTFPLGHINFWNNLPHR